MARCYNCMREYPGGQRGCPYCGYQSVINDNLYYLSPGTLVCHGRYIIGNAINAGGFGIVYRALDQTLNKLIAIKEYYPGGIAARTPGTSRVLVYSDKRITEYEQGKARFLNEARKVAKFNSHPNIVDVYDFFEENNTAYMVMEFMDGMTYKAYIKSQGGKVQQHIAVNVALAVLDALREVHKTKIIHRDINPSNVFICKNGMVKLFDFGAARIETADMTTVLTPHYAPPEQYSTHGKQGPYTDIYAVGAMTYFALTGIKPEESTDRVQEDHLLPPHEVDSSIPIDLSNAIMRAMALKPELRYQSTEQFRDALMSRKNVLNVEQEMRRRKRLRIIQAAGILSVVTIAGGIMFFRYRSQVQDRTLQATKLEVWLVADENDTEKSARDRFLEMADDFSKEYSQIELKIVAFPEDAYMDRINLAAEKNELPDVFDSTYLDSKYLSKLQPLDETCNLLGDTSSYLFLNQYNELFPEKKQMPLCFQVPVIYERLNSDGTAADFSGTIRMDDLKENESFSYSVKPETFMIYDEMLGTECVEGYKEQAEETGHDLMTDSYKMFQTGEVQYYLSDTSDYQMLTEDMPKQFQVAFPLETRCFVRLDHLWSVNAEISDAQKKAGQWLIYYLLSDSAQHILGIRSLEGIPISENMCNSFLEVYQGELSEVQQYLPVMETGGSDWIARNNEYMKMWESN